VATTGNEMTQLSGPVNDLSVGGNGNYQQPFDSPEKE
jgi:hypothetical protein